MATTAKKTTDDQAEEIRIEKGDFVQYVTPNGHHAALVTHVWGPEMVDLVVFPDVSNDKDGFGSEPRRLMSVGSDDGQDNHWRRIR